MSGKRQRSVETKQESKQTLAKDFVANMAKDQASTRIPRFEGASRIPLPGSIRPLFSSAKERSSKNIYPSTMLVPSTPTPFTSIRPPTLIFKNILKKSSSGDGINSAISTVSKNTTSTMKKETFSKPEKCLQSSIEQSTSQKSKLEQKQNTARSYKDTVCKLPTTTNKTIPDSPRPFARSDTFVRESKDLSQVKTLGTTYDIIAQSTPASNIGANEHTCLLSPSDRRSLYTTHSLDLDSTVTNLQLNETNMLNTKESQQHTATLECAPNSASGFDEIIDLDVSQPNLDLDSTFTPTSGAYQESINFIHGRLVNRSQSPMPDRGAMQLLLNSTLSTERLLDLSLSKQITSQLDISQDYMNSSQDNAKNNTQLLYMTSPERCHMISSYQDALMSCKALSSLPLKGAQSEVLLPTHTPDDKGSSEPMEADTNLAPIGLRTQQLFGVIYQNQQFGTNSAVSMQELNNDGGKQDLTESTLDCSIELCDISLSSTAASQPAPSPYIGYNSTQTTSTQQQLLKKQNSFELDESLGILTPDQMKEFLDSTTNTNNLDLPLLLNITNQKNNKKISFHQMRIDQTPSPEELPLDPVEVKTDITDLIVAQEQQQKTAFCNAMMAQQPHQHRSLSTEPVSVSCETELSKVDPMSKSNVSKISNSFITSVTSVTSLDTGYQGDGEMSRPASRGASDHSPSSGPTQRKGGQNQQYLPMRRQDPMTDSDFFTESDADDLFHRGDRRAQVIDGQLYGPMHQPTASVYISEDPQMEDSCMESSGIFTDVENRCDEDLVSQRRQITQDVDMSPDADSTDTVKSNRITKQNVSNAVNENGSKTDIVKQTPHGQGQSTKPQLQLSDSQTSSTILSSFSNDRISSTTETAGIPLSNRTSYCSMDGGSAMNVDCKSFSSLEEVFAPNIDRDLKSLKAGMLLTSTASTFVASISSVKRVTSPRKHASLISLSAINSAHANTSLTPVLITKHATSSPSSKDSLISDSNAESVNSVPCVKVSLQTRSVPRFKKGSSQNNTTSVSTVSPTIKSPPPPCNSRRTQAVNKWDAVMNKIASNKLVKKNYNEVKPKVATGVNGAGGNGANIPSPESRCSLASASAAQPSKRCGFPSAIKLINSKTTSLNSSSDTYPGLQAQQGKRVLHGAVKRDRSYSKDSQKSSQSDLSLSLSSSGSPKLITPLRAAKKRDVRNLSISPTDQGPPPKTQQTLNGISTRSKPANVSLIQKKVQNISTPSSNTTSTTLSTQNSGNSAKSSQANKKLTIFSARRLEAKATLGGKLSIKDHNSLLPTSTELQQQSLANKNGASSSKPPTPITENHHNANGSIQHPNKNDNIVSSPTLTKHGKKVANTITPEKKIPIKLQPSSRKFLQKQEKHSTEDAASVDTLSAAELQELKNLNRHSCNGRLDYQSLEQHLQLAAETQKHQHKGIEAMGVLLQYLVFDLDAFACPAIKNDNIKAKESLAKSQQLLNETKNAYTELQDQLCDKEAYYTQREEELQILHRCELEKAHSSFAEMQLAADEEISSLKTELEKNTLEAKNRETMLRERIASLEKNGQELRERSFDNYRLEMENKLVQKQQCLQSAEERIKILLVRIESLEKSGDEYRTKMETMETDFGQRLQIATERENEFLENIKAINKELNSLRESKDNRERELNDKLILTQDEIAVLRCSSRLSLNESLERNNSPRNSSTASAASVEISRLQSEAESLRCVLELKQKENSKLAKQNEELIRDADERAALQAKISRLESDHEMLQSEMDIKSEKEKELLRQIDTMQKAYDHESIKRKSLSFDKEVLQYKLKQRSEQLHIVEAKLQELSSRDLQISQYTSLSSQDHSNVNESILIDINCEVSPPPSPTDKGMIEKTNSVSWVLEMDNDTPETAASKMVKRAGSFRSVERSPSMRRQLSLSANAASGSNSCNAGNGEGPIPLSQSMSATSVIRQHSNETVEVLECANPRIRSKSVSVKTSEPANIASKKLLCPTFSGSYRKNEHTPTVWKEPLGASSPLCSSIRSRSSTLKKDDTAGMCEETRCRRSSRKLITCDTSSLNSGERLEMRALPTHPSVNDLKAQKKCQEIQESAGEAMVSGTNSEDEGCSASSDEVASSTASTTSSATSGSSSSLNQTNNHHHMSLDEEVLLLDKISSLNGTPMEVSWSDDVEVFASNGSAV